jgi:hypothetical protein
VPEPVSYYGRIFLTTLTNAAAIVAILSMLGFGVLQGYLSSVTGLVIVNIDVRQYLVAGGGLFLNVAAIVSSPLILVILFWVLIIGLFVFWGFQKTPVPPEMPAGSRPNWRQRVNWVLDGLYLRINQTSRWLAAFSFVIALFTTAVLYGVFLFGNSPQLLGGGAPSRVILVFDQPQLDANWPFAINVDYPHQSEPIDMLMQLTDGVLVRDPTNLTPVIVRSAIIRAIIDANPRPQLTPMPGTTPTPGP